MKRIDVSSASWPVCSELLTPWGKRTDMGTVVVGGEGRLRIRRGKFRSFQREKNGARERCEGPE